MILKPHTFSHRPVTEEKNGDLSIGGRNYGGAVSMTGQITPMTQSQAYEDWGVSAKRPHLLIVETADGNTISFGDLIQYGSRNFRVETPEHLFDSGYIADHSNFVLEEMTYAIVE